MPPPPEGLYELDTLRLAQFAMADVARLLAKHEDPCKPRKDCLADVRTVGHTLAQRALYYGADGHETLAIVCRTMAQALLASAEALRLALGQRPPRRRRYERP